MAAKVACPTCGRKAEYSPANPFRPFCSERCKTVDLGAWATNQYVVGGNSQESPSDDAGGITPGTGEPQRPPPQQ